MFGHNSFSEAPFSALSGNNYSLTASCGSYSITGGSATFLLGKTIQAAAGSYTLAGSAASFLYSQVLSASGGSYTQTGYSASFVYNQTIYAGAFAFHLTGNDAQLKIAHRLTANAGSYTIVGNDAILARHYFINGNATSYEYIGNSANLIYEQIQTVYPGGGLPKKKGKSKLDVEREQREELEAIVKKEFDILDGTYQPEIVETVKEIVLPKIKEIDYTQYAIALAQVNALLLQAKIQAAEYESELEDEEALLMLL